MCCVLGVEVEVESVALEDTLLDVVRLAWKEEEGRRLGSDVTCPNKTLVGTAATTHVPPHMPSSNPELVHTAIRIAQII